MTDHAPTTGPESHDGERPRRPVPPPEVPGRAQAGETPGPAGAHGTGGAGEAPAAAPPPAAAPQEQVPPPGPPGGTREVYTAARGWVTLPVETPPAHTPAGLPPEARGPLRRQAAWGWKHGLAGLAIGFGPEVVMYAVALGAVAPDTRDTTVTTASAVALVVISLLVYTWQTGAAWVFSLRIAGRRLAAWGFRLPTRAYFWTIPAALAVVYAVSIVHDIVVSPRQQDIVGEFPHTPAGIALFVLLAVVIAPLFEEIFFRGFLFRAFASSWGWLAGAVASAAVFGVAHAQFDVFLPLFVLGLMLAWVYQRTGSLWTAISLHALFNGLSVLVWALKG